MVALASCSEETVLPMDLRSGRTGEEDVGMVCKCLALPKAAGQSGELQWRLQKAGQPRVSFKQQQDVWEVIFPGSGWRESSSRRKQLSFKMSDLDQLLVPLLNSIVTLGKLLNLYESENPDQ